LGRGKSLAGGILFMTKLAKSRKSKKGFAAMSLVKQRQIAAMGGKAAQAMGKAHRFTSAEASAAGKIGHKNGTAHQFTREEARVAGRKGGFKRAELLARQTSGELGLDELRAAPCRCNRVHAVGVKGLHR